MPPTRANGRDGSQRHVRQPQPQPQPEPIDVDEVIDVDIVEPKPKPKIEGVEYIGSPARARVVGANKGFVRNFRTTEDWKKSVRREERRLERRKKEAVDLTGDDDDADNAPGPSRQSSTRGPSVQSNRRSQSTAMDVDAPQPSGRRATEPIVIDDDDDGPQPSQGLEVVVELELALHDNQEPGPSTSGSREQSMELDSGPESPSDSEQSWFGYYYDEDQEEDEMDTREDYISTADKGKGRAYENDPDFTTPREHKWRRKEVSRFDLHNTHRRTKGMASRIRLWDSLKLLPPLVRGRLETCSRQRESSMYSLACHKTFLSSSIIPRTRDLLCKLTVSKLRQSGRYGKTSGVVNKIAQSNGIVAIASAASGGDMDEESDSTEPPVICSYNRSGNLIFWNGEKFLPPESFSRREPPTPGRTHSRSWADNRESTATLRDENGMLTKYYTINDVAFDPQNGRTMVTSGHDCYVRIWEISKTGGERPLDTQDMMQFHYGNVVNDIQFRPALGTVNPLVAISCYDGWIHFIEGLEPNNRFMLKVASEVGDGFQKTGSFLWGVPTTEEGVISSNNRLFASTEAPDELGDAVKCRHVCFDVSRKDWLYEFSTTQSGDAMALDSQGQNLALITSTSADRTLGIYDVSDTRENNGRPTKSVTLPDPVGEKKTWEVNSAKFSPDDTLLAIGTSDDRVLIYDTRFMGKRYNSEGPCLTYVLKHERPKDKDEKEEYGVTGLEWTPGYYGGRGLGLLTGATDGCVRLWDVGQGHDPNDPTICWKNGIWNPQNVLVECDNGVACFSVGRNPKEHRLVVGDTGGEIYVFD